MLKRYEFPNRYNFLGQADNVVDHLRITFDATHPELADVFSIILVLVDHRKNITGKRWEKINKYFTELNASDLPFQWLPVNY